MTITSFCCVCFVYFLIEHFLTSKIFMKHFESDLLCLEFQCVRKRHAILLEYIQHCGVLVAVGMSHMTTPEVYSHLGIPTTSVSEADTHRPAEKSHAEKWTRQFTPCRERFIIASQESWSVVYIFHYVFSHDYLKVELPSLSFWSTLTSFFNEPS